MSAAEVRPGYKLTEVGVIPEDWEIARAVDLASISTGNRNTQDRVEDGEYPFFVRSATVERIDTFSFDGEAVLTAGDGVGTGKVFHYINGRFDYHQRVYKISDFSPRIDGYYFYWYFADRFYSRIMQMTAKSSVDSVRREMIANMPIPLPPLPEQRAIAAALGDVDALLAALERLIAKRRAVKQAAMDALLSGRVRLVESGEWTADSSALSSVHRPLSTVHYKLTEVGEIPEEWEVRRLEEIAYIDPKTLRADTPTDYEFSYISIENVDKGTLIGYSEQVFRTAPSRARNRVKPGDVLFCTVRPNLQSHLLFDNGAGDWVCSTGFCVLRAKTEVCLSSFVFFQIFSSVITRQVNALIAGSNYPAINSRDVRKLVIPLPPLPEQRAIAEVLSDMDAAIAALERQRAKVQAIKQGMMADLLTGRIRLVK